MYHCSCQEKDNLRKHIHKIHSFRVQSFQAPRFTTTEIPPRKKKVLADTNSNLPPKQPATTKRKPKTSKRKSDEPDVIHIDDDNAVSDKENCQPENDSKDRLNMSDIDEQNLNNKKHESVHNRKNSSITSSLPIKIDFKQTILRNGPNNLSVLVLKSMEPSLSNVEIYRLKEADHVFRTG